MSPQLEQILQAIDQLPLVEQTQLLQQLGQRIDSAHSSGASASPAQKQWQQAIDTLRYQTPVDREKQKARISNILAQFNEDEDEADQQEALKVINDLTKTSI